MFIFAIMISASPTCRIKPSEFVLDVKLEITSVRHWLTPVKFSSFWSANLSQKAFLTPTFSLYEF
jgi:hypothetical protein